MIRKIAQKIKGTKNSSLEGFDLTEITPRIWAMSFPASHGFEKLYRNSLKSLQKYIKDKND